MNYAAALNPACISCGCPIHDDGSEQTDAWLASMCDECHARDFAYCFFCNESCEKAKMEMPYRLSGGNELACSDCCESRAEQAEQDADEAYYGGDGLGSYGPSDPRFN